MVIRTMKNIVIIMIPEQNFPVSIMSKVES